MHPPARKIPEGSEASAAGAPLQEAVPLVADVGRPPTALSGAETLPAATSGTTHRRRRRKQRQRPSPASSRVSTRSSDSLRGSAPTSSSAQDAQTSDGTGRPPPTTQGAIGASAVLQPPGHHTQQPQPSDAQAPAPASLLAGTENRTPAPELVAGDRPSKAGTLPVVSGPETSTATGQPRENFLRPAEPEGPPLRKGQEVRLLAEPDDRLQSSKVSKAAASRGARKFSREAAFSGTWLSGPQASGTGTAMSVQDTWLGLQRWSQFRHPPSSDVNITAQPPTTTNTGATTIALVVVLTTVSTVVTAVLVVLWLLHSKGSPSDRKPVCSTQGCLLHAHIIGINRSLRTAPCGNFGRFVCSGWNNQHRGFALTVREEATVNWVMSVRKSSLQDDVTATALGRPLRLLRSCVRIESSGEGSNTVQDLMDFVNGRIFAWPTRDWNEDEVVPPWKPLRALVELAVLWGLPLWFRLDLLPKSKEQPPVRAVLSPSPVATVFRRLQHDLMLYEDIYSYYVDRYIEHIFSKRPAAPAFEAFVRASEKIQRDIFGNISDASDFVIILPKIVTIGELTSIAHLSPEDWMAALQSVYATLLASDALLLVTKEMVLQAMDTIFRAYTAKEIWFHTSWWFVQIMGPLTSGTLFKETTIHPHWRSYFSMLCTFHADASYGAILAAAHKASLPAAERASIDRVLNNIKEMIMAKVSALSKLDPLLRSALTDTINKTRTLFWPDERLESTKDKEVINDPANSSSRSFLREWVWSREQVQRSIGTTAYAEASKAHRMDTNHFGLYNAALGVISMSVAVLAPPFYYPSGTSAMLYGGLGYAYAKEMVHAVNSMLCLLKDGAIVLATDANDRRALQSIPCPLWCPIANSRPRMFPDLQAIDIAYAAYVRFRDEASDLPLKGLETCSAEQLFFITACYAGCEEARLGVFTNYGFTVALKKFAPFTRAFACPNGSDVNTLDMCDYIY